MSSTARNGVNLFYEDLGEGVPLLFHTGGGGDGRMWQLAGYTQALSGCRHILMDHRGHGQSDAPANLADHQLGEYVADLFAILDAAGVERAVLIGYSGGARVAFASAVAKPERCIALVGIGSVPTPSHEGSPELAARVRSIGMRKLMEEFAAGETEVPPAWLINNLATTSSEMFALALEAWATASTWDGLPTISAPSLLVSGTEECTQEEMDAAVARIPQGEGLRLDGYGHLQTFWHSEVTAPAILAFLRSKNLGVPA
jgi:(E)-2-((N-methylformamido)methylene)succinate hydrolase